MPRKRMIDPEFWNDEEIGRWSIEARLFYIGLWNFADDEGRLRAHPKLLKSQIFPYDDDVDIEKLKAEISNKVLWYQVDGQEYGFVKNFLKHQIINRPSKSRIPAPDKQILEAFLNKNQKQRRSSVRKHKDSALSLNNHEALTESSVNNHEALTESSVNNHEQLTPNIIEIKLIEKEDKISVSKDTLVDKESTLDHQKDEFKKWCHCILVQWNEFAQKTGLPAIKAIAPGSKRERFLKARFKEKEFDFKKILEKVGQSEFLLGIRTDWKVSFDWLICPSNYIKVLEGNYDANHPQKDSVRASRVGENKTKIEYPPGYWDKVLELKNKGVSGEALHEELQKIPEFKAFFQNRPGGQA